MKGLATLPNFGEIQRAGNRLQTSGQPVPVHDFALYCQWARLDPRLAEILVSYIRQYWTTFPLGDLIAELGGMPWPQAAVVLFRFAELSLSSGQAKNLHRLTAAIDRTYAEQKNSSSIQLFFIPLQRPNAVVLSDELTYRTELYLRSGFLGSQSLLPRALWPKNKTYLSKGARKTLLLNLFEASSTVSVQDYLAACRGLVSRRQAQRDLAHSSRAVGHTRNRRFRKSR